MGKYPIRKCPKCGSVVFSVKQRVSGYTVFFDTLDGSEADNSDLHESLTYRTITKYTYCADCGARLFKITESQ